MNPRFHFAVSKLYACKLPLSDVKCYLFLELPKQLLHTLKQQLFVQFDIREILIEKSFMILLLSFFKKGRQMKKTMAQVFLSLTICQCHWLEKYLSRGIAFHFKF